MRAVLHLSSAVRVCASGADRQCARSGRPQPAQRHRRGQQREPASHMRTPAPPCSALQRSLQLPGPRAQSARAQRTPARAQITGGVNSNDMGTNHIIHHTIGRSDGTSQEIDAFRPFVCDAVRSLRLLLCAPRGSCSAAAGRASPSCGLNTGICMSRVVKITGKGRGDGCL